MESGDASNSSTFSVSWKDVRSWPGRQEVLAEGKFIVCGHVPQVISSITRGVRSRLFTLTIHKSNGGGWLLGDTFILQLPLRLWAPFPCRHIYRYSQWVTIKPLIKWYCWHLIEYSTATAIPPPKKPFWDPFHGPATTLSQLQVPRTLSIKRVSWYCNYIMQLLPTLNDDILHFLI